MEIKVRYLDDGILEKQENDSLYLWHGSKHGIVGEVSACHANARSECDFGQAFYLGEDKDRAKSWICDINDSHLYRVGVDFANLECLELRGFAWATYIAINRGYLRKEEYPLIYDYMISRTDGYDVIYGVIADDRIDRVMRLFFNGTISDVAFIKAMEVMQLGTQYALKTENAINSIVSLDEIRFTCDYDFLKKVENERKGKALKTQEVLSRYLGQGQSFSAKLNRIERDIAKMELEDGDRCGRACPGTSM